MADEAGERRACARTHVVLVPGFVGFDALGQLEYYAGVTELFRAFRTEQRAPDMVLHYFDNFPTASVALRAELLQSWIAKRLARGQIGGGDRIALIGHSTGGLDIRRAVYDLGLGGTLLVDGAYEIGKRDVLARISHLVFLSTPHFGTNLADFWCGLDATIRSLCKNAGIAVQLNREPIASLRRLLTRALPVSESGILLALADALEESDEDRAGADSQKADERAARAQLALWLEHMGKDLQVLGDLRSHSAVNVGVESPAHFPLEQRRRELALWRERGISTRSFATVTPAKPVGAVANRLVGLLMLGAPLLEAVAELSNVAAERWWLPPVSLPVVAGRGAAAVLAVPALLTLLHRHPELPYEIFHALCAHPSGAFAHPSASAPFGIAPTLLSLDGQQTIRSSSLSPADSDCVVNTLSMLWPYEPDHPAAHAVTLVEADHGDIIGHYRVKRKREPLSNGRKQFAYDIFASHAGFSDERFAAVWRQVFASCL